MSEPAPVVVGVDGSDDSLHAVRWAADLAVRNGCALVVVHAWIWPFFAVPRGGDPTAPADGGMRDLAERALRNGVEAARDHCPSLEVAGRLVTTSPAVALKAQGESASAVVVGGHGYGKIGSFMLGSVAVDLAGHTRCPLVVIRGTIDTGGPVVVGVDDSPRAGEAMRYAFREAAARGAVIRAVHAWHYPAVVPDWPGSIAAMLVAEEKHARERLIELLAPLRDEYPAVKVEYVTPPGSAGKNLVEASVGAQLVVVGARGRGGFRGLVLGSTSHTLIHHAECPVAVVTHRADRTAPDNDEDQGDRPA